MKYKYLLFLFFHVCLASCQQPNRIDAQDFNEFFEAFINDAEYQLSHTQFPVLCFKDVLKGCTNEYDYDRLAWSPLTFPLDSVDVEYTHVSDHVMSVGVKYHHQDLKCKLIFRYYENNWHLTDYIDLGEL